MNPKNLQNCLRVFRLIKWYAGAGELCQWTGETIARRIHIDPRDAMRALRWLIKSGYLTTYQGITAEGADWYEAQISDTKLPFRITDWKDEVLTGMDRDGNQTQIEKSALHGPENHRGSFVDQFARVRIGEICEMLGFTREELAKNYAEGLIKVCAECGEIGLHWRKGKRGSGSAETHPVCRECMKKRRQK